MRHTRLQHECATRLLSACEAIVKKIAVSMLFIEASWLVKGSSFNNKVEGAILWGTDILLFSAGRERQIGL